MAVLTADDKVLSQKIKSFAFVTRFCLVILQIVFNVCLPDHDAGVFKPPYYDENSMITFLLGGFRRWDALYFMHIAEFGYTYESALAFFPAFPMAVKLVSNTLLYPLCLITNYSSVLLVSATVINIFLFVKSAENLYRLGKHITHNDTVAYTAALLYCINPASVFMSAPYSETIFTYFTVTGLLYLEENRNLLACVYIGLSCVTRSNGLLNLGYVLFVLGKKMLKELNNLWKAAVLNMSILMTIPWIFIVTTVIPYTLLIVLSLIPFACYQMYCYNLYCERLYTMDIPDYIIQYGRENGLKLIGDSSSTWCNDTIPFAYSYVQKHYWHQGLFNYWEFKQIPNFILATPVTILVVRMASRFFKHNRYICLTLGLDEVGAMKKKSDNGKYFELGGVQMLPYVIHAVVLTVFGWFCIHVQVLTRLLFSSTPVVYWFAAQLVFPNIPVAEKQYNIYDVTKQDYVQVEKQENRSSIENLLVNKIVNIFNEPFSTKIILVYFMSYFVVGVAMFSNFLPWT